MHWLVSVRCFSLTELNYYQADQLLRVWLLQLSFLVVKIDYCFHTYVLSSRELHATYTHATRGTEGHRAEPHEC